MAGEREAIVIVEIFGVKNRSLDVAIDFKEGINQAERTKALLWLVQLGKSIEENFAATAESAASLDNDEGGE